MTVAETIRVSDGGDLLSVLPYVVGFHLEESLVVMLMRAGRLVMTARLDLSAFAYPADVAERYQLIRSQHPGCQVMLAAFSADVAAAADHVAMLEVLTEPVDLIESLVTDGQRWWSRLCPGTCCPAEGQPLQTASAAVATAISMGFSPLGSRDDLTRLTLGPSAQRLKELSPVRTRVIRRWRGKPARERRVSVRAQLRRAIEGGGRLDDEALVELVTLVRDVTARDVAWLLIKPEQAELHQQVWSQAVGVAPDREAFAPLALLGAAGWVGGNGALLNCALERGAELSMELGQRYSMFGLLETLSQTPISPSNWMAMSDDLVHWAEHAPQNPPPTTRE